MSRIGRMPIKIPEGVKIEFNGSIVLVSGIKAKISIDLRPEIKIIQNNNELNLSVSKKTKLSASLYGLSRTLVQNAIDGVTNGFEKKLEIHGVGYKAELKGKDLELQMGYSHPVTILAPRGIDFQVQKNEIIISGADKRQVGEVAAHIRNVRKVESYKGKGIRYADEIVKKKVGKKAKAAIGEGGAASSTQ